MQMKKYIVSLDAGTTDVRAMLFDLGRKEFVFTAKREVGLSFPQSGWVEQSAEDLFRCSEEVLSECAGHADGKIVGVGIANQRETVILWDRETGEAVAPAVVWQCRRTSKFCASIPAETCERIREKTGLPMDAYFSASKIKWLIEHAPRAGELMRAGRLCAGTVDTFLIFRFTHGASFVTDRTNASRTMLFNIHTLDWDEELLRFFGVPREILPEILPGTAHMGNISLNGKSVPIAGVAGDQQAALFGQACLREGDSKITYGTGLFLLFNTGEKCVRSQSGLITTIASSAGDKVRYALEGSAFNAGSCVRWLRDGLGLIGSAAESEEVALSVRDSGGVRFVPAFTGLGAPHWNSEARGLFSGITHGTTRAHIVRAVLESIAFGARELFDCMQRDSGISLTEIRCDGGASANGFLMQFQADVLGIAVDRPSERESTALGAALLSAIALGEMGEESVEKVRRSERRFLPGAEREFFEREYRDYQIAVKRALLAE